jgi:hypothetical protein
MEIPMRLDELVIEEAHIRAELLRFDEAFCAAMLQAIGQVKSTRASAFAINRAPKSRFWSLRMKDHARRVAKTGTPRIALANRPAANYRSDEYRYSDAKAARPRNWQSD